MSIAPQDLPSALVRALDACRGALDARAWEHPAPDLQHAVLAALGPVPIFLHDATREEARLRRPDLVARIESGGVLAIEPDAIGGASPARMREHSALATEEPLGDARVALAWSGVFHLPTELDRWPGLRRTFRLAQLSAQSVVPMWMHAHPDADRPLRLLDDLEDAVLFAPRELALRDALEREAHVADPALTALRAIVLAHDVVTQSPKRVETTELPDLCAYAWLDAPAELVPAARSGEPLARAEAWFRWWLDEAIPAAFRAA